MPVPISTSLTSPTPARAWALLQGRSYVVPDDLKSLAGSILGHRVFPKGGGDARAYVEEIVAATPVDL